MRVFDVHNLVADVVCRLYEIDKGMAGEGNGSEGVGAVSGRELRDAELAGDAQVYLTVVVEEAELPFPARRPALTRIFHDRGEGGVGHDEAALAPTLETVGEEAEGIGVALEMREV